MILAPQERTGRFVLNTGSMCSGRDGMHTHRARSQTEGECHTLELVLSVS